jgi:hypothetical protein
MACRRDAEHRFLGGVNDHIGLRLEIDVQLAQHMDEKPRIRPDNE